MTNPLEQQISTPEYTLIGGGYTLKLNGDGHAHLYNGSEEEIKDIEGRKAALIVLSQFSPLLARAIKNEGAQYQKGIDFITQMYGSAEASFAANHNTLEVAKVGYKTKASENLPRSVVYLGSVVTNAGKTLFCYTTVEPLIDNANWNNCDKAIKTLNNEGKYKEFGQAYLPSSKGGSIGTDELGLFFDNKKTLGIKAEWIHGEEHDNSFARVLYCDNGSQSLHHKGSAATAFPVWRVDHLVI